MRFGTVTAVGVGAIGMCLPWSCAPDSEMPPFGARAIVWGSAAEARPELLPPGFATAMAVGDVTGDGIADLLVGAPDSGKSARFHAGDVYLVSGPLRGTIDLQERSPILTLRGQSALERNGSIVALAEMNGDQAKDLVISARGKSVASAQVGGFRFGSGVVRVVDGGLRAEQPLESSAFLTIRGPASLGAALVGGDYNGDGHDDLVLSAPLWAEVYVVFGPRSGSLVMPDDADVRITLPEGSLGRRLAGRDIDGDGKLDLLIDAPAQGRVYLVPGGLEADQAVEDAAAAVFVADGRSIGDSLAIGDLTGDGVADFVIASQHPDDPELADLHVVAGPVSGRIDLLADSLTTITDLASWATPRSLAVTQGFGGYTRTLVAGAYIARFAGLTAGAVWAFDGELRGRVSAAQARRAGRAWVARSEDLGINGLGFAVAVGNTDGDGGPDLVAAAPLALRDGKRLGAVVVFPGR